MKSINQEYNKITKHVIQSINMHKNLFQLLINHLHSLQSNFNMKGVACVFAKLTGDVNFMLSNGDLIREGAIHRGAI